MNRPIITAKVRVSSAEILALNSSPKEILSNPGSNKAIHVMSASAKLDFGTTQYVMSGTDDLELRYGSKASAFMTITSQNILENASDLEGQFTYVSASNNAIGFNDTIVLTTTTGDPITGDGELVITISYIIFNTQTPDIVKSFSVDNNTLNAAIGDHASLISSTTAAVTDAWFNFDIPDDFSKLYSIQLIVISTVNNASADIDLSSDYSQLGEAYTTHSESDTASTYNLTANIKTGIDISGVFSSLEAGDHVGLKATANSANLHLLSLRVKYT